MAVSVATDRLPPQNIDAERSLLGSLLIDPDAIMKIGSAIQPDDFYREQHRAIYEAVASLAARGERADFITVCDELTRRGRLDDAGGEAYVSELIATVPTAFHVDHYATIVRRGSILRRIINGAGQMASDAYRPDADPGEVLDRAERTVFSIANDARTHDFEPIGEILHSFNEELMERLENQGVPTGVPTGIRGLERLTGGRQRGDLIIMAARPGGGKTAFSLHVALHAARQNKVPVGYFSLEMASEQIAQRIMGHEANVDSMKIRDGTLNGEEQVQVIRTMQAVAEYPFYIDDSPGLNVMELRGKARRLHMEHHVGLIVIDYLQLMSSATVRDNRVQEITEITRSLKALARELNIPVVACAQLSRAVEQRPDSKPRLSDLRESGSIEQDADIVIFLYEPEKDDSVAGTPTNLRLSIAKQRNGPTGEVDLRFARSLGRFIEVDDRRAF